MGVTLIVPAEAFRALLRSHYPESPALADEIDSPDWFWKRQLAPPVAGTAAARECAAAFEALNNFYRQVAHHEIQLRGVPQDGNPRDIDAIEQAIGDLNIWKQTFDCSQQGI